MLLRILLHLWIENATVDARIPSIAIVQRLYSYDGLVQVLLLPVMIALLCACNDCGDTITIIDCMIALVLYCNHVNSCSMMP